MAPTADPIFGWVVVGLAVTGAAYYYNQSGKSRKARSRTQGTAIQQAQRRDSSTRTEIKARRDRKGKTGDGNSDPSDQGTSDTAEASSVLSPISPSEEAKKRRKERSKQQPLSKLAQSSTPGEGDAKDVLPIADEREDEGMSNAEFAKRFSGVQTGTSLKKAATQTETTKTRKPGKRNEMAPELLNPPDQLNGGANLQDQSTASSTTGADADDDLSGPVSPEFGATQSTTPAGNDVSDMLEVSGKSPSVLRLTDPEHPQPARQSKQQKAHASVETKKQRQNRKKNELKKAMREEAEQDRRTALEQHKREQREAEGRPAKNGLGPSQPAKESSVNKWAKAFGISDFPNYPENTNGDQLLDTFEQATTEASAQTETNGQSREETHSPAVGKSWESGLPSEEEQMRRISEIDSDNAWTTVPKGKKGKKKASAAEDLTTTNDQ